MEPGGRLPQSDRLQLKAMQMFAFSLLFDGGLPNAALRTDEIEVAGRERSTMKAASLTESRAAKPFSVTEPSVPDVRCRKGRNTMIRSHTVQPSEPVAAPTFQKGDVVLLAIGILRRHTRNLAQPQGRRPEMGSILEQTFTGSLIPSRMASTLPARGGFRP
jgi:hypothetical protein